MTRLRILIVSPGLPHRSWGFGTRVHHLARFLGSRHSVVILAYALPGEEERESASLDELRSICELHTVKRPSLGSSERRWNQALATLSTTPFAFRELNGAAMQSAINQLTMGEPFDVVQVESSQMCSYDFRGAFPGAALVLDEHNVEYELLRRVQENERSRLRRVYNRRERAKFRTIEQRLWRTVDACVVTSAREEEIVRRHAPATMTAVVPNAVDLRYFAPGGGRPEPETMVFTGLLSYRPNLDAVRYLVREILPEIERRCPGVRLTLVGQGKEADLAELARPNVTITGWVPDVRPHLARAAVVVVPVRMGSGTRLKVIEALAMQKAMVSTSAGCEGLSVHDGVHLLVADDPSRFAAAVVRLFSDSDLARDLARGGRELMVEKYSWDQAGSRLEVLYEHFLAKRSPTC